MSQSTDDSPWYQQFWLWFVLTPLFVVIAASFHLLYLAISTNDGVVVDNYYRDGKGYVLRGEEDAFARAANLAAKLDWGEQRVRVNLAGQLTPLPERLELMIIFPTAKDYDLYLPMAHRGLGEYEAVAPAPLTGRRLLQLHPLDADIDWRLHAEVNFPLQATVDLLPKQQ